MSPAHILLEDIGVSSSYIFLYYLKTSVSPAHIYTYTTQRH